MRDSYRTLQDFAYDARYLAPFLADELELRDVVDHDLRAVEAAVLQALGVDVPIWSLPSPI